LDSEISQQSWLELSPQFEEAGLVSGSGSPQGVIERPIGLTLGRARPMSSCREVRSDEIHLLARTAAYRASALVLD
jgi:hypothetical protein